MKQPRFTEQQIDFILRHADVVPESDAGANDGVEAKTILEPNGAGVDSGSEEKAGAERAGLEPISADPITVDPVTADPTTLDPITVDARTVEVPLEADGGAKGGSDSGGANGADDSSRDAAPAQLSATEAAPVQSAPAAQTSSAPAEPSQTTFDLFRKKYAGVTLEEMTRMQRLEDENSRLRLLIARLIVERGQAAPEAHDEAAEPALPSFIADAPRHSLVGRELAARNFDGGESTALVLTADDSSHEAMETAAESAAERLQDAWARTRAVGAHVVGRARELRVPKVSAAAITHKALQQKDRAAALIKSGFQRGPDGTRPLSWSGARRVIAGTAKSARKKSRGREVLLAGVVGGLVGGFAVGLKSSPLDVSETVTLPVDTSVRINSYSSASSILELGWDKPQPWGTWVSGAKASILIGFDGPSRNDVELLVEGRSQPQQGADPPTVIVRYNDAELGRWRLPAQAGQLRRRFIVPAAVFNRSTEGRVSFELPSAPASGVFGIQALSLRDVRFLANFKGFLDTCRRDKLAGWALAEGAPVSVAAKVDGKPIAAQLTTLDRPDLAPRGIPADAGFELTPETPIAPGSKVEVRFANGRPVNGSPCKP